MTIHYVYVTLVGAKKIYIYLVGILNVFFYPTQ